MTDATASMTAALLAGLLGLDGFTVVTAAEVDGELELLIETTADLVGCPSCGAVARPKDRRPSWVRDLPIAGRPVVLCWWKRVWCCPHPLCEQKTWTERHPAIRPRAALTERARQWAFEQVGEHDAAVSRVARRLGVAWWTVMNQVIDRGIPLIEDRARLDPARLDPAAPAEPEPEPAAPPVSGPVPGPVTAVGVDETAFLRATGAHPTLFATGIADLTPGRPARLLDVVEGRSGSVLAGWLAERSPAWRATVTTASLDPFRGYSTALATELPDAVRVLDPFHVVRLALAAVDDVRRRVQQDTTGHRGRSGDPLYGIRRLLRRRRDRLSIKARARLEAGLIAGDPHGEVTLAWTVAQDLMALYQLDDPDLARRRAETLIADLRACPIPELARLGRTFHAWHTELTAHFDHPDVSNGPTENLNLKVKNTLRIARGYRNFAHYRLRLLLNHGRIREDHPPTRIRTRRPRFAA
jgi:transposase